MPRYLSRLLLVVLLAAGITAAIMGREHVDAAALEQWVGSFGVAGPLLFMLVYALATVLFLPGSVLTLAGGALFGPWWGTLYNLTGATMGAGLAFLVARHLAGDWVAQRAGGRMKQLMSGVEQEGWRFVAFVRLVPLFPFNLLNYALGLTRIRFWHYLLATYVCMLPGAIAYTWLGYAGREAVAGSEGMIQKGLLALALLACVAFLPRLIGRMRRGPTVSVAELKALLESPHPPLVLDVRTATEFDGEQGHLAQALNIPLEELPSRIDEVAKDRPIWLICRTDRRSAKAAQLLAQHGFTEVKVVRNGMTAWNAEGYPLA